MRNSLKIQFGKIPRNWQIKQVLIFLYQMLAEEQVYQEDLEMLIFLNLQEEGIRLCFLYTHRTK